MTKRTFIKSRLRLDSFETWKDLKTVGLILVNMIQDLNEFLRMRRAWLKKGL